MILKIQKSKTFKYACITLALNIFIEMVYPNQAWSLTGGPTQPEFSSFTPISTTDMVDLSSGDMNYNIPLMDVGGYPLNIAYSSGIGTDDEASWVGLGWNLSVGQINRNVRGIPDDFAGDELIYENHLKPNITGGANFEVTPGIFGANLDLTFGVAAMYNNYTGFSMKPSVGIAVDLGNAASIGFNVESGPDGLNVSPSVSIQHESGVKNNRSTSVGANFGATWNSRSGVSQLTMGVSYKRSGYRTVDNGDGSTSSEKVGSKNRSHGSRISFTDPLYTPTKRVGMRTSSFTANLAVGGELWGVEVQGQVTGFGTITKVQDAELYKEVAAYGYNNSEKANEYSVLDFNREKDGAISKNSTNLPITNYTYDIYSVQGQGVSGMYRPYRNQVGYVYDQLVTDYSESGSLGVEIGAGNAVHLGIDFDVTSLNAHSGLWSDNNAVLDKFKHTPTTNKHYETVHHKNVGDLSADRDFAMFTQTGSYSPVRVNVVGSKFNRQAVSEYKVKTLLGESNLNIGSQIRRTNRQLRNQAIFNVTKAELDDGVGYGPLVWDPGATVSSSAKDHHINEVQIIRNDGARYIYGQPSYNNIQKEATFAVSGTPDCETGLVNYTHSVLSTPSNLPNDQYLNRVTTPAFVNSHLLSSVLSTDYVDRTGNGPTSDDFGSYTKFTYDRKDANYNWRVPYTAAATYNEGLKTEPDDDQGSYIYGTKELYYIDKIETKTHVAIFHTSPRKDALGVLGEAGGKDVSEVMYKLDSICLYSIEEYNGGSPGTPIKVVHFEYSYSLCTGVPNNDMAGGLNSNEISNAGGKLTLKKVYFTYRNSNMGKYSGYRFNYGEYAPVSSGGTYINPDEYTPGSVSLTINSAYNASSPAKELTGLNPVYNLKAYDTWGNYKPNGGGCANLADLNSADFPYTGQNQALQDVYSSAWSLRQIKLPSGGSISVQYESDDYASVQNRQTNRMFMVGGAGDAANGKNGSGQYFVNLSNGNELYSSLPSPEHINYLYIQVDDDADTSWSSSTIKQKYLSNSSAPIYFRFFMNMTVQGGQPGADNASKFDYVTGYFLPDNGQTFDLFRTNGKTYMSLPVQEVDMEGGVFGAAGVTVNPISKAGWLFGRKYLNEHVYSLQPNGNSSEILDIMNQLVGTQTLNNLMEVFTGPNGALERKSIARRFLTEKSWVRLREPDQRKLGGGCRVTEITMSDAWADMTAANTYQTMHYGQAYEYSLTDGKTSGVATYEPVGNKENPFVQPVFSTTEHLLAPDEENYIETPFGESFFPSPQVTYSRVKVSNLTAGEAPTTGFTNPTVKKLHKTGFVVTEFYTSKDYPTLVDMTRMDSKEDDRELLDNILALNVKKHFTASQGYLIHLNDMNGKQKAQWVYAEGQSTPISGVKYIYDNNTTPSGYSAASTPFIAEGRLNNLVRVINPDGSIEMKTIGVEVDVVNDFRENATNTETAGVNTNLANFFVGVIPGLVPLPLPDLSRTQDQFRSVTTTKVINTFGILRETIAFDAGTSVSTRNLAWDAYTGEVLVTETVDEYSDKYYTFNFPAHWYYKGMAQASMNLGLGGTLSNGSSSGFYTIDGISPNLPSQYLIEGDEISLSGAAGPIGWVTEINGNEIKLVDENGYAITGANNAAFKVVRSGHRNLQSAGIMNITLMENPLTDDNGNYYTNLPTSYLSTSDWNEWKIINAGAVDYSDRWKVGCECGLDVQSGTYNPYTVNEKGVWRTKSSRTYLTGRNMQDTLTPRREGFFTSFAPMYKRSNGGGWYKDFTNWTFVAEVSKYSPYGFELENRDALNRYSAAQYGYNNTFPMAVGANTRYREIGFDGFEDYGFDGCPSQAHFSFKDSGYSGLDSLYTHTGRYSFKVTPGDTASLGVTIDCITREHP